MTRILSPLLVYKIIWLNFLYFHYFHSGPSELIPVWIKLLVCITGVLSVVLHKFDSKNYCLLIHKTIFLVLSFVPLSIDNRTTVALFESAVAIFYLIASPAGFPNKKAYFWLLGLTFFFAGFHKLNSAHLFSAGSCSKFLVGNGLAFFQIPTEFSQHAIVPWLAIGFELLVPVSLALRCYRAALVLLSLLMVAFTLFGFANFASLILVLSIPIFLANLKSQEGRAATSKGERLFIGVIMTLFVLNAGSIFLGYKNQGTLLMYSNLQVYDNHSNHILIQQPLVLSDNLSDLVSLVSSDRPIHLKAVKENALIPFKYFKLQARYWLNSGIVPNIAYRHLGVERTLKTRDDLVKFTDDLSFMDLHFLSFSYVYPTDRECNW